MDHHEIVYRRDRSAAWRLLRADNAPLVLAVLGTIFIEANVRVLSESRLVEQVEEHLYAINQSLDGGEAPAYPRSPKQYVDAWAAPEQGWLRKYYPDDSDEPHYDATVDLEKAYAWVLDLRGRAFIGTESRLHTIVDLLRQLVHGAPADPAGRLELLLRRREEIDREIALAEAGQSPALDVPALLDRYQHLATTARDLLGDFREVEANFRELDRKARERIAGWEGAKGDLLDHLITDRHSIAESDQGRSFQAFYDFLLSNSRQDELNDLLSRLVELQEIAVDPRLKHVHYDWLDAAQRTQRTVALLSEQLRRFLDDRVWLENRRVMDILRSIERSALAVRDLPAPGLTMELDAISPSVSLPMERRLYAPPPPGGLDDAVVLDEPAEVDATSLFEQAFVDTARLASSLRSALRTRDQISLADHLERHPPDLGLAEIIAYLALAEPDLAVVVDESTSSEILFTDAAGSLRVVKMPIVTISRRRATIGGVT